jgi:putative ABC transport system ATP-binding protein
MMPLAEARDVTHTYRLGDGKVQALNGVDLAVERGEFAALAGPSGSGKTTLLNIIGLLEPPTGGMVLFDGREVTGMTESQRTLARRERIGFIFQSFNLIPVLTALENVEYFLLRGREGSAVTRRRAAEVLDVVGLSGQASQRPGQLSGGQRQRVAIARALVRKVDLVLADEPTAALDQASARSIMELMRDLCRNSGVTFIVASHDPKMLALAGRVVRMEDGRVVK